MNHKILVENQSKRIDRPLWLLVCFAMFCFWQMGFVYFAGTALTIDGKTPMPVDIDNTIILIGICYVLSILWMIFLPQTVIIVQRIVTGAALVMAIGLFLPLKTEYLQFLIYGQIFACCFMIGFETFIMVNYFTESSNINHLTFAYGVALFFIALLQNDIVPVTFSFFRFAMVMALIMFLIFLLRMPTGREGLPQYVTKSDSLVAPKKIMFGTYILMFIGALMGVSGPAISGEVPNGVTITYTVDAIVSIVLYFIYRKWNIHPFRVIPVLVGFGGIGFLLMFVAIQVPFLAYIACGLIGVAMVTCQMIPLYGAVMMESYPSKYISPIIISLALAAVAVHGSIVEVFRTNHTMLYLFYGVVTVIFVFIYMQIEPFFLFTQRYRGMNKDKDKHKEKDKDMDKDIGEALVPANADTPEIADPLAVLSNKEREVAELICLGYSNSDIGKQLFISEHTVKTHTKKIYPKLGVHSRLELATLVNKHRSVPKSPSR